MEYFKANCCFKICLILICRNSKFDGYFSYSLQTESICGPLGLGIESRALCMPGTQVQSHVSRGVGVFLDALLLNFFLNLFILLYECFACVCMPGSARTSVIG